MNVKDISIKTQLLLSFIALLTFVVVLGWMTINQNEQLNSRTEKLHNHPLPVQRATGLLQNNILSISQGIRGLYFAENASQKRMIQTQIASDKASAAEQLKIIADRYLGPPADVDSLNKAYTTWIVIKDETIRLLNTGKTEEAASRLQENDLGRLHSKKLMQQINAISGFAKNKELELIQSSYNLNRSLHYRMTGMLAAIFLISVIIYYVLWKNIKKPLSEFSKATKKFAEGDLSARNAYSSKNEFGKLSASLNKLADEIQRNISLHERLSGLSQLILDVNEPHKFFKTVINALIKETGAHMALAYILEEEQNAFVLYESTGGCEEVKKSFDADEPEGELGLAAESGQIQHLKDIPQGTRFQFYTATGKVVPREIMTIPVVSEGKTVAVFSLGSINTFSLESVQLVERLFDILNARVQGVLAFRSIQHFSGKLEEQNRELEIQKFELTRQSAELIEQNRELERQKQQLDEASRFKTSFLSNMSHELRTPLNSVIALTGVLSRRLSGKIPEEEHSYLEVVERNGKHLLSLINEILDLSRIESGREEISITEFNACMVIDEVTDMLSPQAKQKGIELIKTCDARHYPVVSDAAKIRHILMNLIGNAIKFTGKGKVEVICSKNGQLMEIKVADTGIGIEEIYLPYIFEEFKQADSSTSRKFGGTGLGLAIARKYALMLGGEIAVNSTPGKGSEFTLTVPVQYSSMPANYVQPAQSTVDNKGDNGLSGTATTIGGKTILLVDDSEPAIIQMTDILEEDGYKVLTANSGEEALQIVEKTIPDAMVLDLMMPRMDGFQVLQTLREAEPTAHVPVLILTAKHITREELAFLKRNNVHQLIQKGDVNRTELLKTIRRLVFPEKAKSALNRKHTAGVKLKALVAEDNPDNMITIKALLSEQYEVVEAINGRQAVELTKKYNPDFILMDIALPELNGIEAFKAIRNQSSSGQVPVIALTASALTSDREVILAHGFDAYIPKPIDSQHFFETLDAVLYGK